MPLTVYNSDLDTESGRKDYFGETAGVTVSGSEMEIVVSMQEVNGDTVTGLYYLDEASGEYEEAEPTLAEDGSVESFLLNLAYTEERIGIYFVTEKYTYETYADLWLDLANAEKEMASDESVQALESRIEEIRTWDSSDYTASSWEALMQAVEEVEVVLEANTGSYTLSLITAQSAKLEAAVSALVDLTDLRTWIETAEALDEENYRKASYAALTEAIETATGVLNQEDATGDEVLEQVTALKAAIRGLLAVDHLADGQYSLPFTYWKQTNTSSNNKVMVNVTEEVDVIVDGDQMTVILTMQEHPTGAKWATACYYNPDGTTSTADAWSAEATQTDEEGHITEFQYTMDYTEEWIPMHMTYNNVYQSGYLDMDFDTATVTVLKGDATELTALVESTAELEESTYTADSWAAFTEVLTAAETVLAKEMPEQEELDEQTALLQAAIEALIARGDTSTLEEQLAAAEQYLEETGTYQKSSLEDLAEVISEIRAALESADNLSQDDVDALAETLQAAIDALEERLLQDGTYIVPVTVYDAGEDTVSALQGYFDTAQITLDGDEMQVTLYTQEVDGDTVTELFYYDGMEYQSAEAGSGGYTFTVEYTDERLEIYILTDNRNYASYLEVSLDEESATEEEASEEAVEALRESLAQATALTETDYTADSWANMTAVIAGIEETLASQESFTENEISRLSSRLAEAMSALVDLTELRAWIETAENVDAEKYREASYTVLTEAIEAATEVLNRDDATGDEVQEQVTALKAAIHGLLTVDQLADGQYSLPFTYWKQTNTSSNNKVMINVTKAVNLLVDGDQMTVILTMQEHPTGAKWATACYYNPDGTTSTADAWSAEATQTDEDGHITEFQYTMDYTEEWIPMHMTYNGVYQSGYLDLDFDSATVTVLKGDATELTALVESAAELAESDYTADSWAAFAEALAAAETVLAQEMPEQEELDEQTALLQAAIDALVAKGDATALQARIEQAQALAEEDYTAESWEILADALAAAEEVLADADNLGQSELDEAEENLTAAITALKLRGDTSALEALITSAEAYLSGSYTEESLANLSEVLEAVKSAIEDAENLTADEVAELEQQLQEAIDSLEAEETESTAKYKLRILIESCYYEEEDYTEETWSVYAEALANAENVYADSSMTDDDYKEAYTALLEAIDQLAEYDEAAEALAEWVALAEELKETIGETNSGYEETSWAAYVAALSMADEDNPYSLTDAQIRSQIAWLEWESEALILLSDLESDAGTSTASVASLIWDTYEENAISVASEDEEAEIALIDDLEDEEDEEEEETTASSAAETSATVFEEMAVSTETEAETEASGKTEAEEETGAAAETDAADETEAEKETEEETAVETETEDEAEEETEAESEEDESEEKAEDEEAEDEETADEEDAKQDTDELKISRSRSYLSLFRLGSSLASGSNAQTKETETTTTSLMTSAAAVSVASVASEDDDPDDGTYTVNYALYKYDEEKTSMGNPAFVKPATVIIEDGEATVYMELQGMTYSSLYGHLLSIQLMTNLVTDSDGVIESYKLVDPVYVVYTDETDDYGPPAGEKYPQIVGHEIPLYQTNTPVLVNVPVMGSSAEQPARLRIYWDTLTYQSSSTNIDGSIDVTEEEEETVTETLDYDNLNDAIDAFDEATSDTSVWLSASYYAALKSRTAGKTLLTLSGATQTMVDERTTALNLAISALVPVATDDERAELEAKIEEAEGYSISDYTEDSYQNLAQAVIDADKLLMETDITSGMVAKQIKALDKAISALVEDTSTDVKTSELELWISTVKSYLVSDDYTTASKSNLVEALYEAVEVLANQDATQDEVDAQVTALKAAVSALEKAVDKSTLYDLLAEAWTYSSDDYTSESYSALVEALAVATFVYKDTSATSDTVSLAAAELQTAILNLVSTTSDESSTTSSAEELLYSWMQVAAGYSSSDYTEDSWAELATALASARQVYVSASSTSAEKKAAALDIQTAINGLVAVSDSSSDSSTGSSSSVSTDEAYYTVKVRLWHSTLNKASMGDDAVVTKAYVHVDGDQTTMRLLTKKMTVSGITAHLHDFWIYDGTDYEEAELISTENSRWIYEFELPDNSSTYYKCKVDPQVDVMGDDPVKARLKVSWTSLDEIDEDDWDDLEGDTDDEDESNTYSGYTSSSDYSTELVHEETGIRVKGNTGGPGVVLMAEKKEEGDDYERATRVLAGVAERLVVYDIKLRSGESTVQPTAAVTLKIPIPVDYDVSKLVLYRINDDGTSDRIEGAVNGLYYEASVEHFSIYTLIESNAVQTAAAPVSTGSAGGSSTRNTGNTSGTKSSSGSSRSSAAEAADDAQESGKVVQMVAGRVIPYTGDRMPVKELMGLTVLSVLIFAGTAVGDKRRERR
ncbi:MAG: NEAT domain-containing protein [Clostridiales bacterium]|nr:NEAT domain-containing protein [Clostridiales bacterium]